MPRVSKAKLIELFLRMSRPWVDGNMTARQLIAAFVSFYRDFRVTDVDPEQGDRLLLDSSGSSSHHLIDGPTNLIDASDSDLKFSADQYRYVGLSREFWPPEEKWDEDDEDDDAEEGEESEAPEEFGVGLSLFMFFSPPADPNLYASQHVSSPEELEESLATFLQHSLVAEVLDARPTKVTVFSSKIG